VQGKKAHRGEEGGGPLKGSKGPPGGDAQESKNTVENASFAKTNPKPEGNTKKQKGASYILLRQKIAVLAKTNERKETGAHQEHNCPRAARTIKKKRKRQMRTGETTQKGVRGEGLTFGENKRPPGTLLSNFETQAKRVTVNAAAPAEGPEGGSTG